MLGLFSAAGLAASVDPLNPKDLSANKLTSPDILSATSLMDDGKIARQKSIPILLYFSDPQCGYCRKLEKEIFLPMLRSGDYEDRVLLRKVSWLSQDSLKGFDGSQQTSSALAERYRVRVTPTMIFVDGEGREVTRRILGYSGPEFFWFYLDSAIDAASGSIQSRYP